MGSLVDRLGSTVRIKPPGTHIDGYEAGQARKEASLEKRTCRSETKHEHSRERDDWPSEGGRGSRPEHRVGPRSKSRSRNDRSSPVQKIKEPVSVSVLTKNEACMNRRPRWKENITNAEAGKAKKHRKYVKPYPFQEREGEALNPDCRLNKRDKYIREEIPITPQNERN
jgi:hypothetical protein